MSAKSEEATKTLDNLKHAILGVVSPDGRNAYFLKGKNNKKTAEDLARRVARDWEEQHRGTNQPNKLRIHKVPFRSSEELFDYTVGKGRKNGEHIWGKGHCEVSSLRTKTPTCDQDVGVWWHKTTCLHTSHCVWDSSSAKTCSSIFDTVWKTDWYKSPDGKAPCESVAIDHTQYDPDDYCNP
ncbi:MAG TPA: hypothetical protein VNZ64_25010 [Candidatus Acidoferrum sp.]|nr:hypothetical protein [Candidatus Acidoferrum sp.]